MRALIMPLRGNPAFLSTVARDVLREVREAHRAGRLGFLVGAGLSVPIGLPGWNAFNEALLEKTLDRHTPGGAQHTKALGKAYLELMQGQSLAAVDLVRLRAGNDFHVVLRGALYEREQLRKFQPTEVHYALCKLALESHPPFPVLHTTNYDDLLELAMHNTLGRRPRPVHASGRAAADGPRVVHLHGYFPYDPLPVTTEKRLAHELVLSDLDYHHLSNDHTAWTNRELLSLLDSRSVLIVGMSLTDPNVRRVLAYLSEHHKRKEDGHDHFVILQHRPPGPNDIASRAAQMLDEDEHGFWDGQGVKILRLASWDGLNYVLRRIRFTDEEWDKKHRELRMAWAKTNYAHVDFADAELQELGTELLAHHRDRIVQTTGLAGRVELNLFLPMVDGRYRRALSSMPGRAAEAPRWFDPRHDHHVIPEVELALTVGEALKRTMRPDRSPPPNDEPPYQDWYRALISVPYFDYPAGGVPVAVLQLVSSEHEVAADAPAAPTTLLLRTLLREAITDACRHLRAVSAGHIIEAP
jgi:hypothetical protein